jgi:hypothetical protein
VQNSFCGLFGVQNLFCGPLGVQNLFCGPLGVQNLFCGPLGVQNLFCGLFGVQNLFCGPLLVNVIWQTAKIDNDPFFWECARSNKGHLNSLVLPEIDPCQNLTRKIRCDDSVLNVPTKCQMYLVQHFQGSIECYDTHNLPQND